MNTRSYRAHGLIFILLLVLCAAPSGSTHTVLELDALDSSDIALLEDLSEWVADEAPQEARAEIKQRPTSFEVFRSYHEAEVKYRGLSDLPFGTNIRAAAETHEVDALLIAAVIEVESQFRPGVVSHRGAVGLMQVLPSTAADSEERLLDPAINIEHGTRYLRRLLKRYEGDLELALAAYNAGPTNVRRFGGVPPFRETRQYVEKVLDIYISHHRQVWLGSETHDLLLGEPAKLAGDLPDTEPSIDASDLASAA